MRLDITNLTMPDPEAVALLKSEVRRLRAALAALADQDATLSVQGGSVIVTMDATLTVEERGAVHWFAHYGLPEHHAATLRGLLERL